MLRPFIEFKREHCCLLRGEFTPETTGLPVIVALESINLAEVPSNEFHEEFAVECDMRCELHKKAYATANEVMECAMGSDETVKYKKSHSNISFSTDFSHLWTQTAPIPPTAMLWSVFSLLPLKCILSSGRDGSPISVPPRQYQLIYEYYIPEEGQLIHSCSQMLWRSFVAATNSVYLGSERSDTAFSLVHYLSKECRATANGRVSPTLSPSNFGAAFWGEEIFWKLFSSLLSVLALLHSNGFSFAGKIFCEDILCLAISQDIAEEMHDVMSSTVATVVANRKERELEEDSFDAVLSLYCKALESSIIFPQCKVKESTAPHQVFFVLTSNPSSCRSGAPPDAERANQMKDLGAVCRVMECVLGQQTQSPSSAPRNQELKYILECLKPATAFLDSSSSDTGSCPSAVQLLQLQALRLRQNTWIWQWVAELNQLHCRAVRRSVPVDRPLNPLIDSKGHTPLKFGWEEGIVSRTARIVETTRSPQDLVVGETWLPGGTKSPSSRLSGREVSLKSGSGCSTCKEMSKREAELLERERKVTALLELYELTHEQLDALPDTTNIGYEELRSRLMQQLVRTQTLTRSSEQLQHDRSSLTGIPALTATQSAKPHIIDDRSSTSSSLAGPNLVCQVLQSSTSPPTRGAVAEKEESKTPSHQIIGAARSPSATPPTRSSHRTSSMSPRPLGSKASPSLSGGAGHTPGGRLHPVVFSSSSSDSDDSHSPSESPRQLQSTATASSAAPRVESRIRAPTAVSLSRCERESSSWMETRISSLENLRQSFEQQQQQSSAMRHHNSRSPSSPKGASIGRGLHEDSSRLGENMSAQGEVPLADSVSHSSSKISPQTEETSSLGMEIDVTVEVCTGDEPYFEELSCHSPSDNGFHTPVKPLPYRSSSGALDSVYRTAEVGCPSLFGGSPLPHKPLGSTSFAQAQSLSKVSRSSTSSSHSSKPDLLKSVGFETYYAQYQAAMVGRRRPPVQHAAPSFSRTEAEAAAHTNFEVPIAPLTEGAKREDRVLQGEVRLEESALLPDYAVSELLRKLRSGRTFPPPSTEGSSL